MNNFLYFFIFVHSLSFAFYDAYIVDKNSSLPIPSATINDSVKSSKSNKDGYFKIDTSEPFLNIKACGYKPLKISTAAYKTKIFLEPINVKALYLTFWGASNNSQTLKNLLKAIKKTEANAVVADVKNEYGSTLFLTSFEEANSYGAQKNRTNRNIQKFIKTMKERNIYTIARVVVFKDEIQASNNPDYAIKREDNNSIWRNHDNMAWVDPFDERSHAYTIRIAEEAAKVGFDEINFDYIRFPAKSGLKYSKENTQENRIKALETFLDSASLKLKKYGVFISVNTYGNICWSDDDNNIGQTVESLSDHADYLAPMLYPSGFSNGSFYFKYPADHPYEVIYRSISNIKERIDTKRVRPWLQYFKDYKRKRRPYEKFEIQEQIRASDNIDANGWMMWSPSSKYHVKYLNK
ncbi:GTP-binding protein [Sulfurimonas aquatica]|uniref:GTP-binding protein n=1 Tax=Sulfurimonas aquatica TaxID=2672570 RepID=A0A975B098_9BACT|nr:putative glycoside hydrolase [Sulfurimonas aquatica]QSZ41788.1 GTP-binding protein [Sulfurimonas aquatica]